ncbi:MAG: hypothetical protein GY866_30830 [Proteobacteria bacterium]|nr:hypothetical protein [Pseudomonadota bacterium]
MVYINRDSLAVRLLNDSFLEERSYSVAPEYNRTIEKVVISLAKTDKISTYHHEILSRLPLYTQVVLLVPESNQKAIEKKLQRHAYGRKLIMAPYTTKPQKGARYYVLFPENEKLVEFATDSGRITHGQGSLWARDLFVAARQSSGKPLLLVPDIHKWFVSYGNQSDSKVVNDNSYLHHLAPHNMDLVKLPLTFQGGNILTDVFKNRKIVFVGVNTLRSTRIVWKSTMDSTPSHKAMIEMIKKHFNSDEVVVIGTDGIQPPSLMFHLDQAMIVLKQGVVGLTHLVGRKRYASTYSDEVKEVERFLEKTHSTLLKRGYEVVPVHTSVKNILDHQQYVNAVPYLDRETSRKVLLMPVFTSSQSDYDQELIRKNTKSFESLGFRVIHVPTGADKINGGLHCLINVVS